MVSVCLIHNQVHMDTNKNHVKEISWTLRERHWKFSESCYFFKIHNGSRNMLLTISMNIFCVSNNDVTRTCLYGLKISRNIWNQVSLSFKSKFLCTWLISYRLFNMLSVGFIGWLNIGLINNVIWFNFF